MPSAGSERLAFLLGALAAILLILAGVIDFVGGFVFLALGLGGHALGSWSRSILDVVVGIVVGVFAVIGHSGGSDRTLTAGVILVVLAVVGWFGLGFAGSILELLAALFALLSGILYLISSR
jgi:hypothetical protein